MLIKKQVCQTTRQLQAAMAARVRVREIGPRPTRMVPAIASQFAIHASCTLYATGIIAAWRICASAMHIQLDDCRSLPYSSTKALSTPPALGLLRRIPRTVAGDNLCACTAVFDSVSRCVATWDQDAGRHLAPINRFRWQSTNAVLYHADHRPRHRQGPACTCRVHALLS